MGHRGPLDLLDFPEILHTTALESQVATPVDDLDANMAVTKKVAPGAGAGAGAGIRRKGVASGVTATAAKTATAAGPNLKEAARCLQLASDRLESAGTRSVDSTTTTTAFSLPSTHNALETAVDCLDAITRGADKRSSEGLACSQSVFKNENKREHEHELELGLLLPHVSGLRKTAMRVLLGKVAHIKPEEASNGTLLKYCKVLVIGCMVFLVRFLDSGAERGKEKGDRIAAAERLVGTFVESAMYCVKGWIAAAGEGREKVDRQTWQSALDEMRLFVLRLRDRVLHGMEGNEEEHRRTRELDVLLVKISHLYTAAFVREKASDDLLDEITISFLAHSIAAVRHSPREIKDQASYTTKLEKLAAIYEKSNRLAEASMIFNDAVNYQLELGALTLAAEASSGKSPAKGLGPGGKVEVLGRALWGYVRVSMKIARSGDARISWWDSEECSEEERGLVLEWQLDYLCSHLETDRDRVEIAVKGIVKLLSNIYKPESFPLRRKRLMIAVFQIKDADLSVYDEELEELRVSSKLHLQPRTGDSNPTPLDAHYNATILTFQAFRNNPNVIILEQALQIWEILVETLEEINDIKNHIDNYSLWITQLKAMSDFFGMKGTDDLRIRSLETLAKSLQLLRPVDENLLVSTQSKLGHQFLKTGSSGRAGMVLAKAQKLLNSPALATATKLEWNLAYAEYLLSIGNQEKW